LEIERERFEKLVTLVVFGFRRKFLIGICFKAVADTLLSAPRTSSEALGSSGFAPEWALIPEPPGYTVILDKILVIRRLP
jgi:hypothetical protein